MEFNQRKAFVIFLWAVIIIAIVGIWKTVKYADLQPNRNLYQVVLLADNQVFYGKLHKVFSKYPYLSDVYYLNRQQPQLDDKGRPVNSNQQKFTVVKRGIDEIHRPVDRMYIARDKIIYWENVGADSLVAQGIAADKDVRAKQESSPPAPAAAPINTAPKDK